VSATVFFNSASELATLTNTFAVNGVNTNPTGVTLTVTSPTNVVTTPVTSNPSTGIYTADVTCNEEGEWEYVWAGTGAAADTVAGSWTVYDTALGNLYCPIQAVKSRLGITNNNSDYELHAACFAVSRWIEEYTERVFYRSLSASRTFVPRDLYCLRLPEFNDLVSVTSLKTDTAGDGSFALAWNAADYQLLPYNPSAAPEQRPYTEIRAVGGLTFPALYAYAVPRRRDVVQVTGIWGWPKVPYGVRQAALILAADTFKLKDAPFGIEGSPDFGATTVGENRRAMKFLDPYRRNSALVA
jgi:hypothetical protein